MVKYIKKNILDATNILQKILEADNNKDIIYISIILVLISIIIILILVIKYVYKAEINRLAKIRSRLMHDIEDGHYTALNKHNSSDWEDK